MIGLSLDQIATVVARHVGTVVSDDGRYRRVLSGDPAGEWIVELDFRWLRELGRQNAAPDELLGELRSSAEALLGHLADPLVPRELVSPPLPLARLGEVEKLIVSLRKAGAKGTSESVRYAFGMQLNTEIPDTDPAVLTAILKAFVCLYDWLYIRADVDVTRRITTFVDPYPMPYVRRIIAADYAPDLAMLIDDYLEHNPTRNRALDALPLFLHLDEPRVRARTNDALIKPRPAFHYRLPDCNIHEPGWGLAAAWNDWVAVERLAADQERLARCCSAYRDFLDQPLQRWLGNWITELEANWLPDLAVQRSQTPSR
jgi:hypothetical protein